MPPPIHPHGHSHAHHGQVASAPRAGAPLALAAALTLGFAALEALGGWWTGSLALLSDAGHMLTDGAALLLSAVAASIARRPPSRRHTYGLGRVEVFAAGFNAATMLAIAVFLAIEALERLRHPEPVAGGWAAGIALAGLAVNLAILRTLSPHGHDLNTRAARLHVLGDVLGSVAALAAGVVVALTGWLAADPLASLAICALIGGASLRLLREAAGALLEAVPPGLSMEAIGREMAGVPGVLSVHDLHVWMLSGSRAALSAHVVVDGFGHWDQILHELRERLHERFGIEHVTLQPEPARRPLRFYPRC